MPHPQLFQRIFDAQVIFKYIVGFHANLLGGQFAVEMDVHQRVKRLSLPVRVNGQEKTVVPPPLDPGQQAQPAKGQQTSTARNSSKPEFFSIGLEEPYAFFSSIQMGGT